MPKASPIQSAFNAGELSPLLDGRVDESVAATYRRGCRRLENFIPTVQGPVIRRSGTRFVRGVKNHADRTWLARFEFSVEQAYILEFGNEYIRFHANHGTVLESAQSIVSITQANPGVMEITAHGYSNGDEVYLSGIGGMTELNGRYVKAANVTTDTFELNDLDDNAIDTSGVDAYTSGGTAARVYEIASPYLAADMTNSDGSFTLHMVQSGDVIYICNKNYATRKLSRLGNTNWTLAQLETTGGPFKDVDPDNTITVYASAQTGSVTLTASDDIFEAGHVGALFYLEAEADGSIDEWEVGKSYSTNDIARSDGKYYKALNSATSGNVKPTHTEGAYKDGTGGVQWEYEHAGYGYVEITAFASATEVTANVIELLPANVVGSGNTTVKWAHATWSTVEGFPATLNFFRERLGFARGTKAWLSVAADFENFASRDAGEVLADMAISIDIVGGEVNDIEWLASGKALLAGTAAGEQAIQEASISDPLGPGNTQSTEQTSYGSRPIQAVRVGSRIFFVQRAGRKVREMEFDLTRENYESNDTTILSDHITRTGIVAMVFQKEPQPILWALRKDGLLIGLLFSPEQNVRGWFRCPIGPGGNGLAESIQVIPTPDGDAYEIWAVVKRTINGVTRRYIEYMEALFEDGDDLTDAFFVDSGLTYDGSATTTISGLDHLEGETVDILADGATHPQKTVTSGTVTLERSAEKVQIGLRCPCKLQTMRMEAGAADGTAQGKTARITRAAIRLFNTLGGKAGPDDDHLDEILFRSGNDQMDAPPLLFSGDKDIPWPDGYTTDPWLTYVNDQPLPATVIAMMPQIVTQDR